MLRSLRSSALLLVLHCLWPTIGWASDGPWELVRSDDQIVVHRRYVEHSKLHELRGVGVVDAPIAAVLAVLDDSDHRLEWMKDTVANVRIERTGRYAEVLYSRTRAPWPVADRDVVIAGTTTFDTTARVVRIDFRSVTNPAWPAQKGVVRMLSLHGHWTMWPEQGGAATRIEYQLHAEPGGSLPGWLTNLVAKKIPHDTIAGLRTQLRRRQYPTLEHQIEGEPAYRAVLAEVR